MRFGFKVGGITSFLFLLSAQAKAGNEDEMFVGSDAALMGGAVVATVHDGGSVWYNPAGIAGIKRNQLDVTASAYALRLYRARNYMSSAQGASLDLNVTEFVAVPTQISYVRPITPSLSVGLGYYAPRASKLILNESLDASTGNLDSSWGMDVLSSSTEYALGGALGFVPVTGLRLGAGVMFRFESVAESVGFIGNVNRNGATEHLFQVGQQRVQDTIGVEPIAGAQWDVSPALTLGLSVRGPRLSLSNSGHIITNTSVAVTTVDGVGLASVPEEEKLHGAGNVVRLGRYFAGLAYRVNAAVISADADIQPRFRNADAEVSRRLTWNARVGFSYDVSKLTTVGTGLFTDRVGEYARESSMATEGGNFYGGTVGVQLSNEHMLAEGEKSDSLIFTSVFALRYAYASARTEALVVNPRAANPVNIIDVSSTALSVHEFGLYVGSGLYF